MIPTETKSKIAKSESYPLGAAEVTQALEGVPQSEKLKLRFYRTDEPKKHSRMMRRQAPSPLGKMVLSAGCYRHQKYFSMPAQFVTHEAGELEWHLTVMSVHRFERHKVRELLFEDGLAKLRQWLLDNATLPETTGRASFTLYYHDLDNLLNTEVN